MTISKKNKSKVIVDGKEYLWWVFDETDQTTFDGIQIKVVSSDQTHFLRYGLQQSDSDRIIVLALTNYTKLVHLSSPKFENEEGIITKSGIGKLIRWCKIKEHQILYALDGNNNNLNESERVTLLAEIQNRIN
jgi:hypothetical protein